MLGNFLSNIQYLMIRQKLILHPVCGRLGYLIPQSIFQLLFSIFPKIMAFFPKEPRISGEKVSALFDGKFLKVVEWTMGCQTKKYFKYQLWLAFYLCLLNLPSNMVDY